MNHVYIQARMGSTRLPRKVMRPLAGYSMLYRVVQRILPVGQPTILTTTNHKDDQLAEWCRTMRFDCVRGPENDVLARFFIASRNLPTYDTITRITSDCPLVDPQVCQLVVEMHQGQREMTVNTRDWPDGLDCEVMRVDQIRDAHHGATDLADREHVTPWIRREFGVWDLPLNPPRRDLKWSVDTEEDLAYAQQVWEALGDDVNFSWKDVLGLRPGVLCTLCAQGVPHSKRSWGSIGGNGKRYTVWDLHEVEDPGGAGIVECPAWALHRPESAWGCL